MLCGPSEGVMSGSFSWCLPIPVALCGTDRPAASYSPRRGRRRRRPSSAGGRLRKLDALSGLTIANDRTTGDLAPPRKPVDLLADRPPVVPGLQIGRQFLVLTE